MIFHHALVFWRLSIWLFGSSIHRINLFGVTTDLVLLRDLIKNESARGHSEDMGRVFSRRTIDCLSESIDVRAAMPYSPLSIALRYGLLGVKAIHTCSIAGGSVATFTMRCTDRPDAIFPLGVSSIRYRAFNNAMNRARVLAVRNVNKLRAPGDGQFHAHNVRPSPIVIRERLSRKAVFVPYRT